jgi:hypothetical protein
MKILPQRNQLLSGFVLQIFILLRRIFSTNSSFSAICTNEPNHGSRAASREI